MDEVLQTFQSLQGEFEDLILRGLRVAGAERAGPLSSLAGELQSAGAAHLAGKLESLADGLRTDSRDAATSLLGAQATLRLLERVLTLEAAADQLDSLLASADPAGIPAAATPAVGGGLSLSPAAPIQLSSADTKTLLQLLEKLQRGVENLILAGLTAASDATRQTIDLAFREASRMRLLRLGSTLRVATEELGRFTRNEAEFSKQRLSFFLNRAWMLARGIGRAVQAGDQAGLARLAGAQGTTRVPRLEMVTLGVAKKFVPRTFCAFDFRLRPVGASAAELGHRPLIWSSVFPVKPDVEIPAEGYLHLPQKQKFKAVQLLEGKRIVLENVTLSGDASPLRIQMGDDTKLTLGDPFGDWSSFGQWDPQAARRRLDRHEHHPLDLEVELQEEVLLDSWELGEPEARGRDGQLAYPLVYRGVVLEAVVSKGDEGDALRKSLEQLRTAKTRPPLFALMHYERCRLVCQPLALLESGGPKHLMLSTENIDRAKLLKALKIV